MGRMKGIKLKLTYKEADNLASILLSDASRLGKQILKDGKPKDQNDKSILALRKIIIRMENKIAYRIYSELTSANNP